jgi:hypothetical protein
VPDPRHAKSRRHPLSAMLALIALGLLMGARDVLDIWRKVACLSQSQRKTIAEMGGQEMGVRRHFLTGFLKCMEASPSF